MTGWFVTIVILAVWVFRLTQRLRTLQHQVDHLLAQTANIHRREVLDRRSITAIETRLGYRADA